MTTEDVKFSFERYKGTGATTLKDHVREVEIVDPLVARFHLKEPWPDFITFYGTTATAAGAAVGAVRGVAVAGVAARLGRGAGELR